MLTLHLEAETVEGLKQKAAEALSGVYYPPGANEAAIPRGLASIMESPKTEANVAVKTRGRPPKNLTAQVASEDVVSEPVAEAIGEPVVEAPEADGEKTAWDYNTEIKPAVLRVSQKGGRPMVEALLLPFKVTNANQIPPEQHAELMAAIDTLLAA